MFVNRLIGALARSRIATRSLHLTNACPGVDNREKRVGHIGKIDLVEGERGTYEASQSSYELINEDLMDRVFGHTKFKNIPMMLIICSRNNTKIMIYGGDEKLKCIKTAGTEGFKNCRKGTTVAAQAVANRVVTFAKDHDIDMVRLVFDGLGPGRNAAYKVIEMSGLNVVSLSDRTEAIEPWICRPRKAKRL